MTKPIRLSTLLMCCALLGNSNGCSQYRAVPIGSMLSKPVSSITADDYQTVLNQWTRHTKVYRELDPQIFISATLHVPAFRRAFAIKFPDIYGQGGQITRKELVELSSGIEGYLNFFVSIYTPDLDDNDLDREDSIWGLSLISDGKYKAKPAEIVRIRIDDNIRAVYNYVGDFDRAYIVRFPLVDNSGHILLSPKTKALDLQFASALNKGSLRWGVAP